MPNFIFVNVSKECYPVLNPYLLGQATGYLDWRAGPAQSYLAGRTLFATVISHRRYAGPTNSRVSSGIDAESMIRASEMFTSGKYMITCNLAKIVATYTYRTMWLRFIDL